VGGLEIAAVAVQSRQCDQSGRLSLAIAYRPAYVHRFIQKVRAAVLVSGFTLQCAQVGGRSGQHVRIPDRFDYSQGSLEMIARLTGLSELGEHCAEVIQRVRLSIRIADRAPERK